MLLMATWGAGAGGALRGFELKLQRLCGCSRALAPHLPQASQVPLVFSLWVPSAGMKRPDGLGNDEEDDDGDG